LEKMINMDAKKEETCARIILAISQFKKDKKPTPEDLKKKYAQLCVKNNPTKSLWWKTGNYAVRPLRK
jgi:hypothetical protein